MNLHVKTDGQEEWLTPPEILGALGHFDLDPCAPIQRPWPMADKHYTISDNGLLKVWEGRIWLNPPYGAETGKWIARLSESGDGIALTFARTETRWFHKHVWGKAHSIFFFCQRLNFYRADGTEGPNNGGAPSCLIAYGESNSEVLKNCRLPGAWIPLERLEHTLSPLGI